MKVILTWAALVFGPAAGLAGLPTEDGWYRWTVDRLPEAATGCCYANDHITDCQLDRRGRGISYIHDQDADHGQRVLLHAHLQQGRLTELLAVGDQCPVAAGSLPVRDLGQLAADDSAEWLASQLQSGARINGDIHAALASHAGARAGAILTQALAPEQSLKDRKSALFWLGQSRPQASQRQLLAALHDDSAKFREHASFVISQTELPVAFDALVEQGRSDPAAKVRSQAWFWLAQQGDARAEAALQAALRNESSQQVREQMVFALSQLPDARGVRALVQLLEQPTVDAKLRKQALFWLAQSDDDDAWRYLDTVLK
ncbi:MAG: HEAT repeat domain-containing protein [Xanthomonadales bacterium]|nr:HEAT repeat domain-containing protein [Xanthomonadales bacterium]